MDTTANAATAWNLATERLPDEREECLVIDCEGSFYIAYYVYEDSAWHLNEHHEVSITHWAYVYPPEVST
jgi:hypothetical protein